MKATGQGSQVMSTREAGFPGQAGWEMDLVGQMKSIQHAFIKLLGRNTRIY